MEQYSEYKDSGIQWLGKIPRHWKVCKFPYCSKLLNAPCKLQSSQYEPIGIFPIVSQEKDLINGYWNNEDDVLHIDNPVIIFGDHTKTIKYVDFNFVVGADGVRIISPSFDYVQKYYYYSLLSLPLITLGYSRHFKLLKDKYLPLPPLAEQRGIVAYLDEKCGKIDKLLEGKQKQIELLAETKQRVIADTVTRGLNPNVKMKPTNIPWLPQIPEHWEVKRSKYILLLQSVSTKRTIKIGLENIESFSGKYIKTDTIYDGDGVDFNVGDIVYGKLRPYLCKVWLADFDGNAVGDFFVYRVKENMNNMYFAYLMRTSYFTAISNASTYGTKMPRVSHQFIASLHLPVPPLSEQRAIVAHINSRVSKIDTLSAKLRQEIGAIKEYKQRLISDVVTGQMKVC